MPKASVAFAIVAALALGAALFPLPGLATSANDGAGANSAPGSSPSAPSNGMGRSGGISIWHPDVILTDKGRYNAVVAGDFDPTRPGNETVAGDSSGNVWLAYRESGEWRADVVWTAGGNLTSLAAGELDGPSAVSEVAAGVALPDGRGGVFVLSGFGRQISARQALSSAGGVMAVAAGDVQPGSPGAELVALDRGGNVTVAFPNDPSHDPQTILRMPGLGCLLVAGISPDGTGDEIVAGSASGQVLELYWDGSAWQQRGLWVSPAGAVRLEFGDVDPLHDGPELVEASASGELTLLERLGDTWSGRDIWTSPEGVQGLATGVADSELPGNQLVVGGRSNITVLSWDGSKWASEQAGGGWSAACADLRVAEVDSDHGGNEILVAGENGNLTALGLYHPNLSLSAAVQTLHVTGGEMASYGLVLTPLDKLQGNVTMSVGSLPPGATGTFSPAQPVLAAPNLSVVLNITLPPALANVEYRCLVTAAYPAGIYDSLWLVLELNRTRAFRLTLSAKSPNIPAGSSGNYLVTIENNGTVDDSYQIAARVEGGWRADFPDGNATGIVVAGANATLRVRVTVPSDASGKNGKLTVTATSGAQPELSKSASMKVVVPKNTGFCALAVAPAGLLGTAFILRENRNKRKIK
jgi:hypothetical protein